MLRMEFSPPALWPRRSSSQSPLHSALCSSALKPYTPTTNQASPELRARHVAHRLRLHHHRRHIGGYHNLKIDGYSSLKGLPNRQRLSSRPFTVGGRRWRIDYYPNGDRAESAGHMSIFLALNDIVAGQVRVRFRFSFKVEKEKPGLFSRKKKAKPVLCAPPEVESNFGSLGYGYTKFVPWNALEESEHLKADSFTIRCDIIIVSGVRTEGGDEEEAPRFVSVPPSDLNQHLGSLLLNEKGADVVFEAGGETFATHRCVLVARSPVFSAELFGSMKEGNPDDLIRIDDMEAQVFKALLCFVYTDLLPEMRKEDEDVICQHLLVAADKYNMERMKLVCEDRLCNYIDVGTMVNILTLAEMHHCRGLKDACFAFLRSLANMRAAMASEGFENLSATCPSVVKELMAMCSAS